MEDAEIPNENTRLYVIGDIHSRLDLLERVIAAIARDVKEHGSDALTVTLGDYIDRGPASCGVIGRLSDNPFPTPYVALKGNHEVLLEDFLADPAVGPHWWRLGGIETLHSYGVPVRRLMVGISRRVTFFCLLPTKDQASSNSSRPTRTLCMVRSCRAAQPAPTRAPRRIIAKAPIGLSD